MSADYNLLTLKQKKVYSAIEAFIKTKGIPPTVREIGEMVGEKTPGAVQGILNRLEQKGVIKREVGMARSIKLVTDESHYVQPVYIPEIRKVSKRNVNDLFSMYNIVKFQPLPPDLVSEERDCFIISCPDNALHEKGIKYEDMLIVSTKSKVKSGDIALVLYENSVLLRHIFFDQAAALITLEGDDDIIDRNTFKEDEIIIVGRLVGKFTKY